jgi:hypothetical protein
MHFRQRMPLLLLAMLAAIACDSTTTTTTPTTPGTTTTETFSGSISMNGAITHQFAASARGNVSATLTSVGPDDAIIGFSLGTWNGNSCQVLIVNDAAAQGANVIGTVSGVGNLCVRVYDVGKLIGSATYTVDVTHP